MGTDVLGIKWQVLRLKDDQGVWEDTVGHWTALLERAI